MLIETSQDLLQTRAATLGAKRALAQAGRDLPVIVHVTVETTGTMLLGTEIGAALTALEPLGIDLIGLNCATGPAEMSEHLRHLSRYAQIGVSCMPNAGLPQLTADGAHYPLKPVELADALEQFVGEFGLGLVGGCCGTGAGAPAPGGRAAGGPRPRCRVRRRTSRPRPRCTPRCRSGRTPATCRSGSGPTPTAPRRSARRCWRSAGTTAWTSPGPRSATAPTCSTSTSTTSAATARPTCGRWPPGFATASTLPIVLDSTEPAVLQAGLERLGGRAVINSVNYEDGDGPDSRFAKIMKLVVEHGAAVIALTIDEEGQARTADWKVAVAERLITDLTGNWGMRTSDIIIDCLTFPIATGQEETRRDGIETIEAIREVKRALPGRADHPRACPTSPSGSTRPPGWCSTRCS